ncbi:UNVERIFIED_CONTAM: putative receptor-like protein kinase [Sesamum calycinum]|uniref:non-specific serine/threonine protein kinase n=1 Tax=Sesamum calycinum TaxID=2727403 RepID=A0AAW2J4G3_9LAMI
MDLEMSGFDGLVPAENLGTKQKFFFTSNLQKMSSGSLNAELSKKYGCSSIYHHERACSSQSGEEGSSGNARKQSSLSYGLVMPSPLIGLPEISHLGWGHWFTLRDLEIATNRFSAECILGEGGYGVVYRGRLVNGSEVAVKKLLNNLGQAEREFRVEVEAIGNVRHKNLVRLLGYCIEGVQRMLVYEYVNNGNLEQWLHGAMRQHGTLTWEARIKVLLGTARALAYLHEAIEPKVVHRDIKSSNILIDNEFNAKVSDFGLAKLGIRRKPYNNESDGYVAPEYANTGLLNEKSDVYSFGVLLLEAVTGRDPVDYSRAANEVNLVEWLKMMVGNRRAEEVVDPNLEVVRMLETDEFPYREDRRSRRSRTTSMDIESMKESCGSAETENRVEPSDSLPKRLQKVLAQREREREGKLVACTATSSNPKTLYCIHLFCHPVSLKAAAIEGLKLSAVI